VCQAHVIASLVPKLSAAVRGHRPQLSAVSCRQNNPFKIRDLANFCSWHGACSDLSVGRILNRKIRTSYQLKETHMNAQIASKLIALTIALTLNSLIMVGMDHVFDRESQRQSFVIASVHASTQSAHQAT
jgi:hypothetical protein